MNATETTQRYEISAVGLNQLHLDMESGEDEHLNVIEVKPAEVRGVAVDVKIPDGSAESGSHKIKFIVKRLGNEETVTEKSVFLVPR